jgi:hypothetical protein
VEEDHRQRLAAAGARRGEDGAQLMIDRVPVVIAVDQVAEITNLGWINSLVLVNDYSVIVVIKNYSIKD